MLSYLTKRCNNMVRSGNLRAFCLSMGGKAKAQPKQQQSAPVGATAVISSALRESNYLTSYVVIITVMPKWKGMNSRFEQSYPQIGGILARGCASGHPGT